MTQSIITSSKQSPFTLADGLLDRLVVAAHEEPAVQPLVEIYRRTRSDYLEMTAMVASELEHYGIST